MKGVILAAGKGTRLRPFTQYVNKHLLPVGPYPMIFWPIYKLREAGITDILIVVNNREELMYQRLLGNGEGLGVSLQYVKQGEISGLAYAVGLAEEFVDGEKFVVLLGDNLFEDSLTSYVEKFRLQSEGAKVLLKEVEEPERYGIATLCEQTQSILHIEEKPSNPLSNYCVTGIYFYHEDVFERIKNVSQSDRGEFEITDVNKQYVKEKLMESETLPGWWLDAGTHRSLFQANQLAYQFLHERGDLT
ncbi:sugar phosphate nucleotidyltransferase [Priestia koreensis]|uniref:Glucose-1-phosphate thymidylyltransferase n=1 Tax=Priestia koreensis TaxID=284581 RepID=A0A0M0LGX7_9BACI|nr:sugar phosphate nucleotidyltransferase [Priestia koreensis]KOO50340.1 hypothetical protein AMD01_00840 [Priestia koreensis]